MALSPRLEARQSQSLVMTPELQQAIKLLQLTNLEITAYVDEQLEENPLLELAESEPAPEGDGDGENGDGEAADDRDDAPVEAPGADLDSDYDNMWNGDAGDDAPISIAMEPWRNLSGAEGGGVDFAPASEISLRDHLLAQLNVELIDPADRVIGAHLVDMVDDAGYLDGALEAVADRLGCHVDRVETALGKLQRLDPTGVFARDLRECLALQLQERDRLDPAMAALLDNLDLLAAHDLATLKRRGAVDDEDLDDMLSEIRALDPKPGLAFGSEVAQTVMPDVLVRQGPGGDWIVELNNNTLPRVLVNERYCARIRKQTTSKQDKEYISECLHSANWLVKSMAQRATTILRVASELVRQQEMFLAHGVEYLRPLVLRDIAEAIDMHESTVSRVTANKYMITPRGTFEMRYFFTTAIPSSNGGNGSHSSEAVRHRIKALIDREDADHTLSDDGLTAALKDQGIDIARRTVAKYREAMRIPSSVQRRRRKRAGMA
jgi:RNA polymerase sigma-54 factor